MFLSGFREKMGEKGRKLEFSYVIRSFLVMGVKIMKKNIKSRCFKEILNSFFFVGVGILKKTNGGFPSEKNPKVAFAKFSVFCFWK